MGRGGAAADAGDHLSHPRGTASPQQGRARITLCVLTHGRPREVAEAIGSVPAGEVDEILVLDNGSDPPVPPVAGTTWRRSDANLGVSAGRNALAREATGDLLVFVDDDAVLASPLRPAVTAAFLGDPTLGVLAFAIRRPDGSVTSAEYPYRGRPPVDLGAAPCAYFVGCGWAVRRTAFIAVGGFDPALRYSTEEIDLAMRLIRAGWHLRFDPDLVIEHRPSPRGRHESPELPAMRWYGRSRYARRHLPWPVAAVHLTAWTAKTLAEAQRTGDLRPWIRTWRRSWAEHPARSPLSWRALREVHRIGGRVWW